MAATLTVTYICDNCGHTVSYSGEANLYDDTLLVLPPKWGCYTLPDPDLIENLQELCPTCVTSFREEGKNVYSNPHSRAFFRMTFGQEALDAAEA